MTRTRELLLQESEHPENRPDLTSTRSGLVKSRHLIYLVIAVASILGAICLVLPSPINLAPFGIVVGLTFLILTLKHPIIGTYIYLVIFFFEPNSLWTASIQYEKIVVLVVMVSYALHLALEEKKFPIHKMDKAFFSFLVVCFLSIWFSPGDLINAWDIFFHLFRLFVVYVLVSRLANTEPRLKIVVWLYILSLVFISAHSTYNYYSGHYHVAMGINRASSFGSLGDPNSLASSLVIGMPFLFFMMRHYRSLLIRGFLASAALLSLWTIIITGSRGGLLGLLACAGVLSIFSRHKLKVISLIIAVFVVSFVLMPDQYRDRMATITDLGGESSASASARGRIDGLVLGFKFMAERPLSGVGIGNFSWANRNFGNGVWLDAHNLLGKLAGELGLPGIIAFAAFIYVCVSSIRQTRRKYKNHGVAVDYSFHLNDAMYVSIIMLLFQGLTGHNLYRFNWYILAALILVNINIVNNRIFEPHEKPVNFVK